MYLMHDLESIAVSLSCGCCVHSVLLLTYSQLSLQSLSLIVCVQWGQSCSSQVQSTTRWWLSWRRERKVRQQNVALSTVTTTATAAVKGTVTSVITWYRWPGVTNSRHWVFTLDDYYVLCGVCM